MAWFKRWFRKKPTVSQEETQRRFKTKYAAFRELLESNSELLSAIAQLQDKRSGHTFFGLSFVRRQTARSMFHALRMAKAFAALAGSRQGGIEARVEAVNAELRALVESHTVAVHGPDLLDFSDIDLSQGDLVGGKNMGLSQIVQTGRAIPPGFAVSTNMFHRLLDQGFIRADIEKHLADCDPTDETSLRNASEAVQAMILSAPIPPEAEQAMLETARKTCAAAGLDPDNTYWAVRSSAVGEDSDLSHAGQYLTALGAPTDKLAWHWRLVAASLFTPRATAYRYGKGAPLEDAAMAAACLVMIDAKSAGVSYSIDPVSGRRDQIVVQSVWGLGAFAVDGVVDPDRFVFAKSPLALIESTIRKKTRKLMLKPDGYTSEAQVPDALAQAPSLSDADALEVAEATLALERRFGRPLDVEWAFDHKGKLIMLQARPLHSGELVAKLPSSPISGKEVRIQEGETASPGAACGPVHFVDDDRDLIAFPKGAVLVAAHSSPKLVSALIKSVAAVVEHGGVTGHMAALAREFNKPAVFGAHDACRLLKPGELVTVDADSGRVYAGRVDELLSDEPPPPPIMRDAPVMVALERVLEKIAPLNLTDPKSPAFKPDNAKTLHDCMRWMHELSYGEMFALNDSSSTAEGFAVKLKASLPLDLYCIDLGGGLSGVEPGDDRASTEQVASTPFKSLLEGMLHPDLKHTEPRPISFSGFMSVMSSQMLAPPPQASAERFGDKSYALVSDKYLNFSSRVGYHYGILDAYCGQTVNKNYIHFEFKGGAADSVRKNRRARAIAGILETMCFSVEVVGDRVAARFDKYPAEEVLGRLVQIGRLFIFTRQMDMLMVDEASVEDAAAHFADGKYAYCPMD